MRNHLGLALLILGTVAVGAGVYRLYGIWLTLVWVVLAALMIREKYGRA